LAQAWTLAPSMVFYFFLFLLARVSRRVPIIVCYSTRRETRAIVWAFHHALNNSADNFNQNLNHALNNL